MKGKNPEGRKKDRAQGNPGEGVPRKGCGRGVNGNPEIYRV